MRNLGVPRSGMFDQRADSRKWHVARAHSGEVTTVFTDPREREGAHGFLDAWHVNATEIAKSMFDATAKRDRFTGHFD